MSRTPDEPIEQFLDELLLSLRVPARDARRILAETEAHLRDTADALEAEGASASPTEAEREAVRRFGSAVELARSWRTAHTPSPFQVATSAGQMVLLLVAIGLVAIGLSGGITAAMNAAAGYHLVGALPMTYSAHTCAGFAQAQPTATSCTQAAMWEVAQDAVSLRVAAGVVGLLLLGAAMLWRRRLLRRGIRVRGIGEAGAAVASAAFGAAAVFFTGQAIDLAVQHGSGGVGWYLSGGLASAVAFVPCAVLAYRGLRPILTRALVPALHAPT